MRKLIITFLAILGPADPSLADNLKQVWSHPPRAAFESTRSVAELELCLGIELSPSGLPSVIRGPDVTIITTGNGSGGVYASVKISERNGVRFVEVGKGFSMRAEDQIEAVKRCAATS